MAEFYKLNPSWTEKLKEQGFNVHTCKYGESKEFTSMLPIAQSKSDGNWYGTGEGVIMSEWVAYCPYCGEKLESESKTK